MFVLSKPTFTVNYYFEKDEGMSAAILPYEIIVLIFFMKIIKIKYFVEYE